MCQTAPSVQDTQAPAREAGLVAGAFAAALLAERPLEAAAYFAPNGHLLTPDGTEVRGHQAISLVLTQLTESEHELSIRNGRSVAVDDVALTTQHWLRRSPASSGEEFESLTKARLVLKRSSRWQILIAAPWG